MSRARRPLRRHRRPSREKKGHTFLVLILARLNTNLKPHRK